LERTCEYKVDINELYIDDKQANDTINRAELVEIMKEFGITMKLVRLVKMTLANTNSKVKIQRKLSPSFETMVGLRQGDSLSTLLFNPLNPELNPICYLLALLGAHHFLHVSRIRIKLLTFRRLSYIYMEHPFLMFLDHTQRRSTVGRTPLDE